MSHVTEEYLLLILRGEPGDKSTLIVSRAFAHAAADRIEALREALDSMVRQFAYAGNGRRTTGGLSALEEAFAALGWDDPHPLDKEEMCDEPGCKEPTSCGFPTPNGYRRTCGEHYRAANPPPSQGGV